MPPMATQSRSLVKLEEHEAAEEACRTALQLLRQLPAKLVEYSRGLARTWRTLGLVCFWRSHQLEAAAQVETAAQKWQEALQAYEEALELEPQDSFTHFNAYQSRAEAYLAQKQRGLGCRIWHWPSRVIRKPWRSIPIMPLPTTASAMLTSCEV